jgi:hypothetical protein
VTNGHQGTARFSPRACRVRTMHDGNDKFGAAGNDSSRRSGRRGGGSSEVERAGQGPSPIRVWIAGGEVDLGSSSERVSRKSRVVQDQRLGFAAENADFQLVPEPLWIVARLAVA